VAGVGKATVKGSTRKVNEDRTVLDLAPGAPFDAYVACFDGHGGPATAQWLAENFLDYAADAWGNGGAPDKAMLEAYLAADAQLLGAKQGLFGMGERGVGGSKCGSTSATTLFYRGDGGLRVCAANAGDARILLVRKGGKGEAKWAVDELYYEARQRCGYSLSPSLSLCLSLAHSHPLSSSLAARARPGGRARPH